MPFAGAPTVMMPSRRRPREMMPREIKEPPGDSALRRTRDRLDWVGQPGGPVDAQDLPAAALKAGVRHADPHSGDGSLSGSHLASPISMHYLGPPAFRV